jgi:hypothetical protein
MPTVLKNTSIKHNKYVVNQKLEYVDDIGQCWIFMVLWWPFWKWRPVEIVQSLSDFNAISYVGTLWCLELIPDIEQFLPVAIFKMATTISQKIIQDIIIYQHMKFWWYRTMLNFCGIVVAILKMATSRNCSMSRINSGHHYLPTYQIVMISDNVEFLLYVGR